MKWELSGRCNKNTKECLMTNEELNLEVALNGWKGNMERAGKMFSGLSNQEVLKEIAPENTA